MAPSSCLAALQQSLAWFVLFSISSDPFLSADSTNNVKQCVCIFLRLSVVCEQPRQITNLPDLLTHTLCMPDVWNSPSGVHVIEYMAAFIHSWISSPEQYVYAIGCCSSYVVDCAWGKCASSECNYQWMPLMQVDNTFLCHWSQKWSDIVGDGVL